MSGFYDTATCSKCGYKFMLYRQGRSAGKIVSTYCPHCEVQFKTQAGTVAPTINPVRKERAK